MSSPLDECVVQRDLQRSAINRILRPSVTCAQPSGFPPDFATGFRIEPVIDGADRDPVQHVTKPEIHQFTHHRRLQVNSYPNGRMSLTAS